MGGRIIRPWYSPEAYGVEGGPWRVKCHSKRLDSKGAACKVASGFERSSVASLRMRFIVGDLVLNVGRDIATWAGEQSSNEDKDMKLKVDNKPDQSLSM